MAGGAEAELGHRHCCAGCEKCVCNSRGSPRIVVAFLRMSPALLCLQNSVQAPRAATAGAAEKRGAALGKMGMSQALQRRSSGLCHVCVVFLLFPSQRKKQDGFQLSCTETGTSESGLAKLMCRKALGVNLKRWVEAVMHMIKVKHAAYTENC